MKKLINCWTISTLLFTIMGFSSLSHAATVTYNGTLSLVDVDTGTGTYTGAIVGDSFSGNLTYGNDASEATEILASPDSVDYNFHGAPYNGFMSDGATVIGGSERVDIYIGNNTSLDAEKATLISNLLGTTVSAGTIVDVWVADSYSASAYYDINNNLLNGVSFGMAMVSLDTNLYSDTGFKATPPGIADVDLAFFWIDEYDASGNMVFSASGTLEGVSTVPVPAAIWLFGSGLIGLIGIARRRK